MKMLTANEIKTGMEIMELATSTANGAYRLGMEQAARYTARGYQAECVGVIAYESQSLTQVAGETLADWGYQTINRQGFRPVLKFKTEVGE
jgi:hypothetical protein